MTTIRPKDATAASSVAVGDTFLIDGATGVRALDAAKVPVVNIANVFTATQTFGALVATTLNGNTFTAGTGVLTIAAAKTLTVSNSLTLAGVDGKTLTVSNSLTLAGVDGVTITGPATSGTIMTLGNVETVTGAKTFNDGKLILAGSSSGSSILKATAVASGTLTLPAATDTLIGKATTDILTNKTFDSAGTGNVLKVSGVTVSAGQYPGETSTGSATAGNVGEYVESVVVSGSAVALTTATDKDITTLTLSAGDWDVDAVAYFLPAGTPSVTVVRASLSQTLNTVDTTPGRWAQITTPANTAVTIQAVPIPPYRFSLSGSTTLHLAVTSTFSAGTMGGYGIIRARRVR